MDIKLYFEEKGSGFPLILLHGNGEDHTYFLHQMEYFSKFYRVIAVDTRGHGSSPRGEKPFTLRQFADDLHEFMVEQGILKAHILGFSDGGNIALLFGLKYPERVEKMIVDGANLYLDGLKEWVKKEILEGYERECRMAPYFEEARKNADLLKLMIDDPNIEPEELKALSMPVLVMAGTDDMIEESHTELIYTSIPNAKLVWIEGDHFIAAKNPNDFNLAVQNFLA